MLTFLLEEKTLVRNLQSHLRIHNVKLNVLMALRDSSQTSQEPVGAKIKDSWRQGGCYSQADQWQFLWCRDLRCLTMSSWKNRSIISREFVRERWRCQLEGRGVRFDHGQNLNGRDIRSLFAFEYPVGVQWTEHDQAWLLVATIHMLSLDVPSNRS